MMLSQSDAVSLNSTSLDLTTLSISADYLSQSHLNTQQLKSAIQLIFTTTTKSFLSNGQWKELLCSEISW